jgi:hypothetical protein
MDAEALVARDVGHHALAVERFGARNSRHGKPREKDGKQVAPHRIRVA